MSDLSDDLKLLYEHCLLEAERHRFEARRIRDSNILASDMWYNRHLGKCEAYLEFSVLLSKIVEK